MNRQIRLSTAEQIQNRLKEFAGKKINIVLRNRKVLFGILRDSGSGSLTFVNLRGERLSFPLDEVDEVYLDSNQ